MARHEQLRSVDLALRGGGSPGAFTWRALDRLLADERIDIGGASDTSAGAMNAVVLVAGLRMGGREGARESLRGFWDDVWTAGSGMFRLSPSGALFQHWHSVSSPLPRVYDIASRLVSPYNLNPLNLVSLGAIVERHVDFRALQTAESPKVFVSATNVRTGRPRVFCNPELTLDAVLASACLPLILHAVEIEGEHYWDGGYSTNPALLPLIAESQPRDLMLIQNNPVERPSLPRHAHEIIDRINEISFKSSLNAMIILLTICRLSRREASTDVFMVAAAGSTIALVTVVALGTVSGAF